VSGAPDGMVLCRCENLRLLVQCELTKHDEWNFYVRLLNSFCLKPTHNPAML
jgi:hypothetical protein